MNNLGETLIISEELLKLHSPLSKNVSVDKIFPYLQLAQPYYVAPVLGKALMTELQLQVESGEITDENKALIIKVAPVLSFYATYLAMRSLAYTISEKGITTEKSDNSSTISEKELGEYILSLKQMAEMHRELLIKFLCECRDSYPLWKPDDDCNCDKYDVGDGSADQELKFTVYFPKKKGNGCSCK